MKHLMLMAKVLLIGGLLQHFTSSVLCSATCQGYIDRHAEHASFMFSLQRMNNQSLRSVAKIYNSRPLQFCWKCKVYLMDTSTSRTYHKGMYIYCHSNDKEIQLPSDTFQNDVNISFISLSNSTLENFPEDIFQPLKNLIHLDLSHNQLADFQNFTFKLSKLLFLFLNHNSLTNLKDDIFLRLVKLQYLNLSHNKLHSISPQLFRSQGNLLNLSLEWNGITSLSTASLFPLKNLEYLELSGNPLEVRVDCFRSIQKIKGITIPYNSSLECNCKLKAFWDWSQERNLSLNGNTICLRSGGNISWSDIHNCKNHIDQNLSLALCAVPVLVVLMICIALFYHYLYKPLLHKRETHEDKTEETTEVVTYSLDYAKISDSFTSYKRC